MLHHSLEAVELYCEFRRYENVGNYRHYVLSLGEPVLVYTGLYWFKLGYSGVRSFTFVTL